jgi:hypothetical protein
MFTGSSDIAQALSVVPAGSQITVNKKGKTNGHRSLRIALRVFPAAHGHTRQNEQGKPMGRSPSVAVGSKHPDTHLVGFVHLVSLPVQNLCQFSTLFSRFGRR